MKLAVVIGHNSRSQGAVRVDSLETEYSFNGRIADLMAEQAKEFRDLDVRIFRRQAGLKYRAQIRDVYARVDLWQPDLSMELHFNSVGNSSAHGCLMLSSGSAGSLGFAQAVQKQVTSLLSLRDRGVFVRGQQDRGGESLFAGRAPAILTEPFFGSNREDLDLVSGNEGELADAYLRGAVLALQ